MTASRGTCGVWEMAEGGKARKESRRKKRACSQAISQPIELPRPFSTAFGFSPSRSKTFGIVSLRHPLRFSMWQLPAPDPLDQSRLDRDFNMNCLLMATYPRGRTIRRYLELSTPATPAWRHHVAQRLVDHWNTWYPCATEETVRLSSKGIDPSAKAFNASLASKSFLPQRLREIVENINKFCSFAYGNLAAE